MSEIQQSEGKAFVTNIVRAAGAVFMLAGVAIGLNLGGIAAAFGLADGGAEKMEGGIFFIAGIIGFFILPGILVKLLEKPEMSELQQSEQRAIFISAINSPYSHSFISCMRAAGAVLMLAGVAFGFNFGGIADVVGWADGVTEKTLGIFFFGIGIFCFFVLPRRQAKRLEDNRNSQI